MMNEELRVVQSERTTDGCIRSRLAPAEWCSDWDADRVRVRRVLLIPMSATPQRASHIGSGAVRAPLEIQVTSGAVPAMARIAEATAMNRIFGMCEIETTS